jgi:3',5'-cyclic AMP phosphodiesterase CpdA
VAVEVRATPLANKIIEELPRRSRRAYDQFEADLAARGCAALTYRLSGDLLDHLCVVHLIGTMRAIVAFESADVAYVILAGNHDDSRLHWISTGSYTRWRGTSLLTRPDGPSRPAVTPRLASHLWIPGCWMNC